MLKNARRVGRISTESGKSYLELDFWFPEIKLALEFQVIASTNGHIVSIS